MPGRGGPFCQRSVSGSHATLASEAKGTRGASYPESGTPSSEILLPWYESRYCCPVDMRSNFSFAPL